MRTRLLGGFVFGALALAACGDAGTSEGPESLATGYQDEEGVYSYVIGYDAVTDTHIIGGAHAIVVPDEHGKAEAIDAPNTPTRLHPDLRGEYTKYDAAVGEGESDFDVFASSWWAQSNNGIAKRWAGSAGSDYNDLSKKDDLSPIEKYDVVFNPGQQVEVREVEHHDAADLRKPEAERGEKHKHEAIKVAGPATAWEMQHHGVYQDYSHPDSWWGHCNGWAAYATSEEGGFPKRDVKVKLVDGKITECVGELESDPECVLFRMGDVEALMSELYFSDRATFAGRRCNTDPDKMERDEFGRPKEAGCRDLNAGSWHIAVTGLLGKGAKYLSNGKEGRPAFIIDHNYDWEVWNFPVKKFKVDEQVEISAEEANSLVGATGSSYRFNSKATKFVRVKMRYWMVSDGVSDSKMLLRADQRDIELHEQELRYVLELDKNGVILGGEWLKIPSYSWSSEGETKELHPDFFWMSINSLGYGEDQDDKGGNNDNPHVSYKQVKALLTCANDATTCAPDAPATPAAVPSCADKCDTYSEADGRTCWCDEMCSYYGDCCADKVEVCGA